MVHSLKDLPTEPVQGLVVAAYPVRADVGDMLLVHPDSLTNNGLSLKPGVTLGTSAARRQALSKVFIPQATVVDLRGNVPTRIEKCLSRQVDGIILARAGIVRLGLSVEPLVAFDLVPKSWIPAPGQGCLAVQCRTDDDRLCGLIRQLNDPMTEMAVSVERGVLNRLEGGCHAACGVHTWQDNDQFYIKAGAVLTEEDGWIITEHHLPVQDALSTSTTRIVDKVVADLRTGRIEECKDWRQSAMPWTIQN